MSIPEAESGIQFGLAGGIARVTLARPARRNALNDASWRQLEKICAEIANDAAIRVVILAGEGEHFCAGADIHELKLNIADQDWMRSNQRHISAALDAYAALPQPTIAAIRGCCFGGGAALAVASDFRVASTSARFAVTPARLGLTYRLIECLRLSQLIGPARAREMLLLSREIDSAEALAWGLVNVSVADGQLAQSIQAMTDELLALSCYSQRGIKATLLKVRDGAVVDDAATISIFEAAFSAPDFRAAAAAFAAKSSQPPEK